MLPRLRQATGRITKVPSSAAGDHIVPYCTCSQQWLNRSELSARPQQSRKGKEVSRLHQTRSFRSSTAFSLQPLPSTSSQPSTYKVAAHETSNSSLAAMPQDVMSALNKRKHRQTFLIIANSDDETIREWPRAVLDAVFSAFTELSSEPWSRIKLSHRRHVIKRIRRAFDSNNMRMSDEQVRAAFRIGVMWEHERRMRQARGEAGEWNAPDREAARMQDHNNLRSLFESLPRSAATAKDNLELLELDARTLHTAGERGAVLVESLHSLLRLAPSFDHKSDLDSRPSAVASSVLPHLFESDECTAISFMHLMLDKGHLPLVKDLQSVLRQQKLQNDSEQAYAHARAVLDSACSNLSASGKQELDQLLQDRLNNLNFEEAIDNTPILAFIGWLGEDSHLRATSESRRLALRLWESTALGFGHYEVGTRLAFTRALDAVVVKVCSLNAPKPEMFTPSRATSPTHKLALDLALEYLPQSLLVDRARYLLNSSVQSRGLLRSVYDRLHLRAPPEAPKPFQWHANMLPAFVSLNLAFAQSDPALLVQLYHEWTAVGMAYPQGLWSILWKSLGRRGNLEELKRIVEDFESTGRGRVGAPIVIAVVEASAATTQCRNTLRLLGFLRSRGDPGASSGGYRPNSRGQTTVLLRTYHAVLQQLAYSRRDRRSEMIRVFSWLIKDEQTPTTETFNVLLAAQVFRPRIEPKDIDNAGAAYNALIRSSCEPDAITYSLLIHGFLRMGSLWRFGKTRNQIGIDASLRTFYKAADSNMIVRGQQVAKLMRLLARRHRWDEAKAVAERWWASVVQREKQTTQDQRSWDSRTQRQWRVEMREVELASEDILRSETSFLQTSRSDDDKRQRSAAQEDADDAAQDESYESFDLTTGAPLEAK